MDMNVTQIVDQARSLSAEERRELIRLLQDTLEESRPHSILELAGLGEEVWNNIDTQTYLDQLRNEWDDRS